MTKPNLSHTTLLCADTSPKAHLALRAIEKSLEQCDFGEVKLLTNRTDLKYAVKIPELKGLAGYSNFCIREMAKYVDTEFALVVQFDGYVQNGSSWTNEFLKVDFSGALYNPSGICGNGGFSNRSKRLLDWLASRHWPDNHPCDSAICIRHREEVERAGFRFAPPALASKFAIEGRAWNSKEWQGTPSRWNGQFGFHSWLTPGVPSSPNIYHHSGDSGDVIYGLAVVKSLGGGMMFLSTDNHHPYPLPTRWARVGGGAEWVDNLAPLIEHQSYVWGCKYTHGTPFSTTMDLNKFRLPWKERTARDFDSILKLHCDAFNVPVPTEPWLTVSDPIVVPDRPIVVSLTERYRDDKWPWYELVQKHHAKMVFVGTEREGKLFQGFSTPHTVPHYKTENALELARVIAGSKVFIGNQSLGLAIAHGLHKFCVVQEWPLNRNCRVPNPRAHYGCPTSWLR